MSLSYLAIDKNITVHEREKREWLNRGISEIRLDTMTEGIKMAMDNRFYFIVINADNIEYLPILKVLREVTTDPILIATSNFTVKEQIEALHRGADFYCAFDEPENNLNLILAVIHNLSERAKLKKTTNKLMVHGDIIIHPQSHRAFIRDIQIKLTSTEMKLMQYFMLNKFNVLSHRQIYDRIHGGEYDTESSSNLYGSIKRLRRKMLGIVPFNYIETVREVGYRFITKIDTNK